MLNLTLADRVGRDTWICAVHHCMKITRKETQLNYHELFKSLNYYGRICSRKQNADTNAINFYCCNVCLQERQMFSMQISQNLPLE